MKIKTILAIVIILPTLMITLSCSKKNQAKQTWQFTINNQLKMYPEMAPQDIYKVIYQGVLGPNHLGKRKEAMEKYLKMESDNINPDSDQNLIEKIAPEDKYIRINLKRYKADNGDLDLLCEILYQSCVQTDISELQKVLDEITQLINDGKINYSEKLWKDFYQKIKEEEYFVPHHSENYIDNYDPAYRVVSKKLWEETKKSQKH